MNLYKGLNLVEEKFQNSFFLSCDGPVSEQPLGFPVEKQETSVVEQS